MRALAVRRTTSGAVIAAGALAFAALFLAEGTTLGRLVWIGGAALLLAAIASSLVLVGVVAVPQIDRAGAVFLTAVFGLAVWSGLTTIWSVSPEDSWQYTNRTLAYAAFALVGALVAAQLPSPGQWFARGAALLLAALYGWALLSKCVPSLYTDYGRLARLRAPLDYWNELALLAAVGVPVALWLASRRYLLGVLLLYGAGVTVLLTYSRFGVALACLAAVASIALANDRVVALAATATAGAAAAAVFGVSLALPGITKDAQTEATRMHDGWIFVLVLLGGATAATGVSLALRGRLDVSPQTRRRIERVALAVLSVVALGAVVAAIVFAGRIWHSFANPVSSQIASNTARLGSLNSSNRWSWWQEAWHAFTRHPGGGTGAGTFQITDALQRRSPIITTEPHNVPLQFLSETGVVGFLLLLVAAVAAVLAVVRTRARAAGGERAAVTALGIGAAVFLAHLVVDVDWDYVATCGPLLLLIGALVVRGGSEVRAPSRRPLLAVAATAFALAAIYSLAAPWLAQRDLATATTVAQVKRAHAYDPLSTDALTEWAAFEEASNPKRADQLFRDAVALEPENANVWFEFGDFLWDEGAWSAAYQAYSRSWHDDRFGPAGVPCGKLDQARHKVLGVWPPSCPGGRPSENS